MYVMHSYICYISYAWRGLVQQSQTVNKGRVTSVPRKCQSIILSPVLHPWLEKGSPWTLMLVGVWLRVPAKARERAALL